MQREHTPPVPGAATDGQRQGWLEELAGEWTPKRVLYLARAAEIDALCEALNDLPALLARVEAAERRKTQLRAALKQTAALVATAACLKRPEFKHEPWDGPCGRCAPCLARAVWYDADGQPSELHRYVFAPLAQSEGLPPAPLDTPAKEDA